jgi:phosphate:Na+ symporter
LPPGQRIVLTGNRAASALNQDTPETRMYISALTVAGGLGLFLLGMMMLTEGLRDMAGVTLHRFMRKYTKSPYSGATTVATVGFVGAGLMTFNQALGVIFGANIGTTATGWLVALVGFKLQLGVVLMPLTLVGVLLIMFAGGWLRHLGWALAGFSLLFIGISSLQQGMVAFEGIVTPSVFPSDTLSGRVQLVAIGMIITLVTQSSSAGIAAALAALASSAISFPQAAAMVIGMNVGTTFTAVLASAGGAVGTRRTGYAHVIYNVMTGIMAFTLLYPLDWFVGYWHTSGYAFDPQIALVAFHTMFNLLGVLLVIGFTPQFARLVIRLVPERGPALTSKLDDSLLGDPSAATFAAVASVGNIADALFGTLVTLLETGPRRRTRTGLQTVANATWETRLYNRNIRTSPADALNHARHMAVVHSLDHLDRLHHRCGQKARIAVLATDPELAPIAHELVTAIKTYLDGQADEAEDRVNIIRQQLESTGQTMREATIDLASQGTTDTDTALLRLDAIRWLRRASFHVWRIMFHHNDINRHLAGPAQPTAAKADDEET